MSTLAADWVNEALPELKRKDNQTQMLKNFGKSGDIPQINHEKTKYRDIRGIFWNPVRDDNATPINFIGSDDQKRPKIII